MKKNDTPQAPMHTQVQQDVFKTTVSSKLGKGILSGGLLTIAFYLSVFMLLRSCSDAKADNTVNRIEIKTQNKAQDAPAQFVPE